MAETKTDLTDWIGRSETRNDRLSTQPARFMQATLDRDPTMTEGDALPPLWHWLYFLDAQRASDLGRDAHPRRGGFLPPVALPRRMWAGGRLTFHAPLLLGQDAKRHATIRTVTEKNGRSGPLCFVTIKHQISAGGTLAVTEEQDLVFRDDPAPNAPPPTVQRAPRDAEFTSTVSPTSSLLFRYSALTFNGHRIHYDADYARDVEGYAGLVTHGPLIATLLADLAVAQRARALARFSYRGIAPIAGAAPFDLSGRIEGDTARLWAHRGDALCMSVEATFA